LIIIKFFYTYGKNSFAKISKNLAISENNFVRLNKYFERSKVARMLKFFILLIMLEFSTQLF